MAAPAARICRHCGMAIGAAPFARDGEAFCCEGCYYAARNREVMPENLEDAGAMLAEALATALDAREHETGLHSKRVACHTVVLARRFSSDAHRLREVYCGALLHDIGKIGIPDSILLKEGPLDADEWRVMRTHPEIGHRIVSSVPFMAEAAELVLCHEERYDGSGYPRGLAGKAIPLWARLFAVIDALDAITSDRPYRKAQSFEAAMRTIESVAGTQFDPVAVQACVAEQETLRAMVAVKCGDAIPSV